MRKNIIYSSIIIILLCIIAVNIVFKPSQTLDPIIFETSTFEYQAPQEVSRTMAFDALIRADSHLEEMKENDLSVFLIRDLLLDAKRSFIGNDTLLIESELNITSDQNRKNQLAILLVVFNETLAHEKKDRDYAQTHRLATLIDFKKNQAYTLLDLIPLVGEKEKIYRRRQIDITEGSSLLERAKKAFFEERYDEAESLLLGADTALDRASVEHERSNALINSSKNFFIRYWWQTVIFVLLLLIFTPLITKKIQKSIAKAKLEKLQLEQKSIKKLIVRAQKECFKEKKIMPSTYELRADLYRKRLADIDSQIPVYEALLAKEKKKNTQTKKRPKSNHTKNSSKNSKEK